MRPARASILLVGEVQNTPFSPQFHGTFFSVLQGGQNTSPFYLFSYYCIFSSTCITLYPFYTTAFCFLLSPIPCLFTISIPYVTQLPFAQKVLLSILLSFCPLIITSSTPYQSSYFPLHCPSFHAYDCSSWRQSLYPTMLLYLLPYSS